MLKQTNNDFGILNRTFLSDINIYKEAIENIVEKFNLIKELYNLNNIKTLDELKDNLEKYKMFGIINSFSIQLIYNIKDNKFSSYLDLKNNLNKNINRNVETEFWYDHSVKNINTDDERIICNVKFNLNFEINNSNIVSNYLINNLNHHNFSNLLAEYYKNTILEYRSNQIKRILEEKRIINKLKDINILLFLPEEQLEQILDKDFQYFMKFADLNSLNLMHFNSKKLNNSIFVAKLLFILLYENEECCINDINKAIGIIKQNPEYFFYKIISLNSINYYKNFNQKKYFFTKIFDIFIKNKIFDKNNIIFQKKYSFMDKIEYLDENKQLEDLSIIENFLNRNIFFLITIKVLKKEFEIIRRNHICNLYSNVIEDDDFEDDFEENDLLFKNIKFDKKYNIKFTLIDSLFYSSGDSIENIQNYLFSDYNSEIVNYIKNITILCSNYEKVYISLPSTEVSVNTTYSLFEKEKIETLLKYYNIVDFDINNLDKLEFINVTSVEKYLKFTEDKIVL